MYAVAGFFFGIALVLLWHWPEFSVLPIAFFAAAGLALLMKRFPALLVFVLFFLFGLRH